MLENANERASAREESLTRTSIYIARILRHKPELIGIELDRHGWADVEQLIAGVSQKYLLTMETLEEIVRTDEKQRYSFSDDHKRIRANQGHSIPVDVELKRAAPPAVLYHGTADKFVKAIQKEGLKPQRRLYVHLSTDIPTAIKVGERHGRPFVFRVDAAKMAKDGCAFYVSVNKVWMTEKVPAKYLTPEKIPQGNGAKGGAQSGK